MTSLIHCAQETNVTNRRGDYISDPRTGPQGSSLIGQMDTGKERVGGAQPMGEEDANLARDGREAGSEARA